MSTTTIVLIVLAIIALWVIASFNSLITLSNRAKEAWADIAVQLSRR
jgi:LemA protein